MKKTALTFVAMAFGTCVAFAQTNPTQEDQTTNTEQTITTDNMSDAPEDEMAGRRVLQVEELPEAVRASLESSEFKDWEVVSVTELQANAHGQTTRENMANVEGQENAASGAENAAVFYEVELISKDMQDEISDTQEQTEELQEEVAEEGNTGVVEEAAVSVRVPGVTLRFDQSGNMISQTENADDASTEMETETETIETETETEVETEIDTEETETEVDSSIEVEQE